MIRSAALSSRRSSTSSAASNCAAAIEPIRRISLMTRLRSSSWLLTMWLWGWVMVGSVGNEGYEGNEGNERNKGHMGTRGRIGFGGKEESGIAAQGRRGAIFKDRKGVGW